MTFSGGLGTSEVKEEKGEQTGKTISCGTRNQETADLDW